MAQISIIHPSRGRPEMASHTMINWYNKADNRDNIEYRVILDQDDTQWQKYIQSPPIICTVPPYSCIRAVNNGSSKATGDILIVISDDMDCPEHWDTLLLEAIGDRTDFCAKAKDGHQDWLITLPIMDRKYYERFGYVYYPGYDHMYADTDMTAVAWMLDKYVLIDLTFKHSQPRFNERQADQIDVKNAKTWAQGRRLFLQRLTANFGVIDTINELPKDELKKQGILI